MCLVNNDIFSNIIYFFQNAPNKIAMVAMAGVIWWPMAVVNNEDNFMFLFL